ncbi:Myb family transcription factor PHL5, partial [Mucuna pruriens]
MHHSWQVSNGAHSSLSKVEGSEKDSFIFQQYVFDVPVSCLNFDSQDLLGLSSWDNSTPQFGSVAHSFLSSDEDTFCETYGEIPCRDVSLHQHFGYQHNNILEGHDSAPVNRVENVYVTSGNSASSMVPTRKKRIKWTNDLHEQFVAAVDSLGGPQKAKPKAVLKMMDSKSLTIFHVKSHLQKYRTTTYVQNNFKEGNEERQGRDMVAELQQKIRMQIEESRQLQLEIRGGIQQQLEVQRNLQMLIEEQKKQVKGVGGHKQTKQIGGSKSWENKKSTRVEYIYDLAHLVIKFVLEIDISSISSWPFK